MDDFVELVKNTPLHLYMNTVYLSKNDKHLETLIDMGVRYENLPLPKKTFGNISYGCLLGIYAYTKHPEKLNAYINGQTIDEQGAIFEEIELLFMEEYDVNFTYSPFRLCKWPETIYNKYLKAKTDKARKIIALEALEGAIDANFN